MNRRVLIIVPVADIASANESSQQFDPVGWAKTFTVPLYNASTGQHTHCWASFVTSDVRLSAMRAIKAQAFPFAEILDFAEDEYMDTDSILSERGLRRAGLEDA